MSTVGCGHYVIQLKRCTIDPMTSGAIRGNSPSCLSIIFPENDLRIRIFDLKKAAVCPCSTPRRMMSVVRGIEATDCSSAWLTSIPPHLI